MPLSKTFMEDNKLLLASHGIAYQLQVQLFKLPSTAAETKNTTKLKLKLKPNKENKSNGLHKDTGWKYNKSDKQLLILNGITSHIRICIVRQEKPLDSRKPSCIKRIGEIKKVYNCPICLSHVEFSPGFLTKHLAENHKSTNILKCSFPKCEFSTWISHFLKTHLANVHHQLPFHCSVCSKKFKNHSYLRVHMLSHAPADSKKYICPRPNCEFSTHYADSFRDHLQSHDLKLKYKCPHCSWKTKYEKSIAVHMEKTHGNSIKFKPFKCPHDKCNFTADKLTKVKSHSKVHTDHKPFKCHLCKFSTKYRNSIRSHMMVHSGLKPFECYLCRKKIRTSQNLTDHLRRHLGEKPFKCSESTCDYVAATRSEIKLHVNQHHSEDKGTRLKSFNCPLCTKTFYRKEHLVAHITTHTLEKPFSCTFCSRDFGTTSSKSSHEKCCRMRPDGIKIKPHNCNFCKKIWNNTSKIPS